MHILLIDDSRVDATVARAQLGHVGDVTWVRTLEEAKAALQKQQWDVVLADLDLGGEHEIANTIHVLTVLTSATPVIAFTAHSFQEALRAVPQLEEWDGHVQKGSLSGDEFRQAVLGAAQVKISRETARLLHALNQTLDDFLASVG